MVFYVTRPRKAELALSPAEGFKVALASLAEGAQSSEKDLPLKPESLGLGAPFIGEVLLSYELNHSFGKVYGRLRARAKADLDCSRCLKPFEQELRCDAMLQFEEKPAKASLAGADPEDPELNVAFFEDGQLNLGEELRQELELQVPYRPLCRKDCAGLCPRCGADLNNGPCGCDPTPQNSPFAKLKGLLKTGEND